MHLYIHIPYCKKKCAYCDFLSVPVGGEEVSLYVKSLLEDIKSSARSLKKSSDDPVCIKKSDSLIDTVYIGGGTPGILPAEEISLIMDCVKENYSMAPEPEITIEVNPCTVTEEKLQAYKKAGINWISMGVQSFNDESLMVLGRAHDAAQALSAYDMIRKAGFDNVNLDLISCIPGESREKFENSLKTILKLAPEHISVYQLIIEEGTSFYNKYGPDSGYMRDEDEEADIYTYTAEFLKSVGYEHYEISNFAKEGFRSKHNMGYWKQENYIGCGAGAVGNISGRRIRKHDDIKAYIEDPTGICEEEVLDKTEQQKEYIMLGLRTVDGISESEYLERYGCRFDDKLIETLNKYRPEYIIEEKGRYHFTEKGFLVSNAILTEMI